MPEKHSRRHRRPSPQQVAQTRRLHLILLSLLVLVTFASTLGGDFVWTDREDIVEGQHRLLRLADIPTLLTQAREAYRNRDIAGSVSDSGSGSWQPLTVLSNTLSWSLWGDCSACFHAENVLLHLLCSLLVLRIARRVHASRAGPRRCLRSTRPP